MYCTDSATKPVAVEVVLILGTRSPIMILAISRLRVRMRGLARTLVSPLSERALMPKVGTAAARLAEVVLTRSFSVTGPPAVEASGVSISELGQSSPSSSKRLRLTSSISTSSITSGSGMS